MALENVKNYLKQWGFDERVREFQGSSATVELAAKVAGVVPGKIAKTLSFKVDDKCILVVAAGDTKIDNKKYKEKFKTRAKMLSLDDVIKYTGHAVGGVCPFDIKDESTKVYLDISMKRFETVLPAAGSSNSCVELTLDELEVASKFTEWVDVCKL